MNEKTELGLYHYKLIFSIEEKIHRLKDENLLFDSLIADLKNNTSAQIGIFFKMEGTKLVPASAFGIELNTLKSLNFDINAGYAGWAIEYLMPLKSDNISLDKRLSAISDPLSGTGLKLNSVLAVPVFFEKEALGVIELLNSSSGFTAQDIEAMTVIARHLAINLKNRHLLQELGGKCNYLSKIVSSLSSGLLVVEENQKIVLSNPKALEIMQLKEKPSDLSQIPQETSLEIKRLLKDKKNLSRQEFSQGEKVIGYSCMTVKEDFSKNFGLIFLFQDITAYKKAEAK